MAALSTATIFNINDVISTAIEGKSNAITYRIGWLGNPDNPGAEPDEAFDGIHWGQYGLAGRPAAADPNGDATLGRSAQVLSIDAAGENHVIAVRDLRNNAVFSELGAGETSLHCGGENKILLNNKGGIVLSVAKGDSPGGSGTSIVVNADGSVSVTSSSGSGVDITVDGKVSIGGPAAQPIATTVEVNQLLTLISALQVQIASMAAAWAALGALSGPVLGVMLQPIAAPIAGVVAAQTAIITSTSTSIPQAMSLKNVSSD